MPRPHLNPPTTPDMLNLKARLQANSNANPNASLHASCVLVGAGAILIRGASGSGKSSLALALLEGAAARRCWARLVSDDRTLLRVAGGRLIASVHPQTAGLAERRGLGLVPLAHEPAAIVRLVVDCLGTEPDRMPEPEALVTELMGVTLPRIGIHGLRAEAGLVLAAHELFQG